MANGIGKWGNQQNSFLTLTHKTAHTLSQTLDNWNFSIFKTESLTTQQPLRYIGHELFKRYNLLSTHKVSQCMPWILHPDHIDLLYTNHSFNGTISTEVTELSLNVYTDTHMWIMWSGQCYLKLVERQEVTLCVTTVLKIVHFMVICRTWACLHSTL